jgi:hypothetical protein
VTCLGVPTSSREHLKVLGTILGVPAISLGAPRITVEEPGKNIIFFGNNAGVPGNQSNYLSFNDFYN